MRTLDISVAAHLNARGTQHAHLLVWLLGRNRETSQVESIGFWTGADHESFVVGGQARTYYGAGTILKVNPMISEAGLNVRTVRLVFSSIPPEVQLAVRGYDIRKQPCEMHVAHFDPATEGLIGGPQRVFKGYSAGVEIVRPEAGEAAECTLSLLSSAKALTRTLTTKKSDTALRARHPEDGFRKYSDISGTVEAVWGENRAAAPSTDRGPSQPTPSETFGINR
jgi:hypothetical protein